MIKLFVAYNSLCVLNCVNPTDAQMFHVVSVYSRSHDLHGMLEIHTI